MSRTIRLDMVLRRGLAVASALVLMAGAVVAQPAEPPVGPSAPLEAPATEEAPPVEIPAPAAVVAAPVTAAEVAPAAAPREKVAEKIVEEPVRRTRYDIAVLQALDKVTAETLRFEVPVGRPVRWKGLVFSVSACERSASDEPIDDSMVYLMIESQPRAQPGRPTPPPREAFRGWMFAESPGLHPLEHASYDAWVISCRASRPLIAAVTGGPNPASGPKAARPELKASVAGVASPSEHVGPAAPRR